MNIRVLTVAQQSDRPEAESFIRLRESGIDICVMCEPGGPHIRRLMEAGVPVELVQFHGWRDPSVVSRIRERLTRESIDILHLYHNKPVSCGVAAATGLPTKVVAYRGVVGNVSFLDPISWQRYLSPRIDRLVCVCDAVRDHFLGMRLLGLRVPEHKPVRVYKGHDLSWYGAEPVERKSLGLPADAFVVGCVANARPRKGIDVLVRAMELLPEAIPAHLVLVGEMESRSLDAQIARSPIRGRVHRLGFRSDASSIAGAFDVAVLPSRRREGLPRSIIEAMAYATAPVVTDAGGSKELVVDGRSGLVVRAGDASDLAGALVKLYRNPNMRREMGRAARRRIEVDFRHEVFVDELVHMYQNLAGERVPSVMRRHQLIGHGASGRLN